MLEALRADGRSSALRSTRIKLRKVSSLVFLGSATLSLLCGVVFVALAANDDLVTGASTRSSVIGSSSLDLLVKSFRRPPSLTDPDPKAETLRAYAAKSGLYFGSMADSMAGNGWETPWVQKVAGSEFNLLEPGNQLKWWMTQPTQGTFDFGPGDALVDYAVAHDMKVRGHNLLWGMANPEWLGNKPASAYRKFSGQQLEDILINHIRTVMSHYRTKYPGAVRWWDVTNEVMGWNNKFNSDDIEWTNIGSSPDRADYLRLAFRTARVADPEAVLCMNDWGNEGSLPDRTQNMIEAVRAFRAEGIPIDCAGMEAHVKLETPPTYTEVLKAMKAYAEMGVQVQITEFDITARLSDVDWSKAAKIASDILKACVNSPNCTAFNNWGFSQAIYLNKPDNQNAVLLPWDQKNQATPEYFAMRDVLKAGAD
jgi:endo-1,4-beta-xylanase